VKQSLFLAVPAALALAACNPQNAAQNAADNTAAEAAAANAVAAAPIESGSGGTSQIAGGVTAGDQAPPPIPDYPQPPAPAPDYVWTPGYWAWNASENNYYWAPGLWARPPRTGLLWTPGYWAFRDGVYAFTGGHWGPRVGFYGGVNYGYGYGGSGYQGGEWRGGHLYYNAAVTNVPATVTTVYQRPVPPPPPNRPSFVGGPAGMNARPTPQEAAEAQGPHVPPTAEQAQRERQAFAEPQMRAATVAHGGGAAAEAQIQRRPPMAASPMAAARPPEPRAEARPPAARPAEPGRRPEPGRPQP
jgi:hypothetical protein